MQELMRSLTQGSVLLWAVFGLGVLNVVFAVVFGTLTDRWIDTLLHSPRIAKARTDKKLVESYCRLVERLPMKTVTIIFGVILMMLALTGLVVIRSGMFHG